MAAHEREREGSSVGWGALAYTLLRHWHQLIGYRVIWVSWWDLIGLRHRCSVVMSGKLNLFMGN